ncbi:MAG: PadR family transcriptional regulator [Longimicrobiales bacterium]|nr:PadR family transcriptional regulator [Longimicrobiales bacterium]
MKANRFHILAALAEEDLHGLGIVRNVLDQTDGSLRLWPATLYGSLEALAEEGFLRELKDDEVPRDVSAQRRYYRLTRKGREALRDEANRMTTLAAVVLERLERA